jgi:CRISP-associated protein Cas1
VRAYTAPPLIPDQSGLARRQARVWADADGTRLDVARRMYAWRLNEILPHTDIASLRGIEGARVKQMYKLQADRFKIKWTGRRYDRANPLAADLPNQALNHAASAVEAAAAIAVSATATIPQLGFIHEDSGQSFVLDIADLFRDDFTVPVAFVAAAHVDKHPDENIERTTRKKAGLEMRKAQLIDKMIDRIKQLFADPASVETPAADKPPF